MHIKIIPVERRGPPGHLAEVELHFDDGVCAGLKLVGFGIWGERGGEIRSVTFPARQYSVSGERRSFALLRPITDSKAVDSIKQLILEAYQASEEAALVE